MSTNCPHCGETMHTRAGYRHVSRLAAQNFWVCRIEPLVNTLHVADANALLQSILAHLDGQTWTVDTMQAIDAECRTRGIELREP